jgi:type III pantothenate kinase
VADADLDADVRRVTYEDVPIEICVDEPHRVGIDRLAAAVAADYLRTTRCPAIIVDHGTAITVDTIDRDGSFLGGIIFPGIALLAQSLAEGTDALPLVPVDDLDSLPSPIGKSTTAAIRAGLSWGVVGAVREIVIGQRAVVGTDADVMVTGGGGGILAQLICKDNQFAVRYEPHLVLSGIVMIGG